MGISSLPSPSEGVLSIILINTLFSITTFASILRSVLDLIRIHHPGPPPPPPPPSPFEAHGPSSSHHHLRLLPIPTGIRFGSMDQDQRAPQPDCDCSVCLVEFETESEVSRLPCGHFFHRACLQRWLDCWKLTCPLCRSPLLLQEQQQQQQQHSSSCPWF